MTPQALRLMLNATSSAVSEEQSHRLRHGFGSWVCSKKLAVFSYGSCGRVETLINTDNAKLELRQEVKQILIEASTSGELASLLADDSSPSCSRHAFEAHTVGTTRAMHKGITNRPPSQRG